MPAEHLDLASFAFAALFFIIDPLGNVPLFLAITQQNTAEERKQIVKKAIIACFCILTAFLIAGRLILELFHITIGAFKISRRHNHICYFPPDAFCAPAGPRGRGD